MSKTAQKLFELKAKLAGTPVPKPLPTDREILDLIYNRYYEPFARYSNDNQDRKTKMYIPINIKELAMELRVDPDIIFGRLYYHLEEKYGFQREDRSRVSLFALDVRGDPHCVNFPLMASVLADLRDEAWKFNFSTVIAIVSLVISLIALRG